MNTVKNNKTLAITFLITLFLTSSSQKNPSVYEQAPAKPDVMGISDTIKLKMDHRGVFYYVSDSGNMTDEPVYLSSQRCTPQQYRGKRNGVLGMYDSMTRDEDLIAAIELQCKERKQWEQDNKQRIQRERIYGYRRRS